jgi:IS30 family transposase
MVDASDFQPRRPLSDAERESIATMANKGVGMKEIEEALGRTHGTIATVIHAMRKTGTITVPARKKQR